MVRQHSEPDVAGSHDVTPLSTTTTTLGLAEDPHHGFISSNVYEYFNSVEAGQVPAIPITNVSFISLMRNANGETLLIAAARCGNLNAAEALVKEVDIEETDNDGWSALLNAAHQGHAAIVELLLDAGAVVDQHDLMGWTSLMWACYKNHLQAVDVLLKRKAHINIAGEEDSLTPLIIASGRGYTEIVYRLLESSAQINSTDKFGSTALIWAARRGHLEIVMALLNAGAKLDAIGMYASTALMLTTRGNHIKVVDALISRDPNVNIVDYNGLSALGIAAREGYTEIAQTLIQSGAYVNIIDRFGNSILASAVRSGNIQLVRMLLEKHADVNAKDSDNRTPLHLAIDKGYGEIALALLEKRPNLEIRNKDGETALLRAVKNRDLALCQLLISVGAKLSATDNSGDNALHLALRARSRRITQVLLVNPGDSKLLYRPNKLGETPYSIDQEAPDQPILPTIFGPIGNTDLELKNLLGYDSYGDVLADVVCEPNLSLPLTIGLYAKWGSGKSLLLPKIRQSMKSFSRSWLEGMELYWSWKLVFILFVFCAFGGLCFASVMALSSLWFTQTDGVVADLLSPSSDTAGWLPPVIFAISLYVVILSSYGFVYYGSEVRLWNGSITTARFLARSIAHFKVLLSVLTLRAPMRTKELVVSPVSFLFADDHRLSFVGAGEQALANIVQSLFLSAEDHYGTLAVRLFTAFNFASNHTQVPFSQQQQPHGSKLQTFCGIPTILYMVVMFISVSISMCFLLKHAQLEDSDRATSSYAILSTVFFVIFLITALAPLYLLCVRLTLNLPKRRIARIAHNTHLLPFERVVQKLQRFVDQLVSLVSALDAFTNCQTRMVIMVDGLDSCEQNKMVQMLDALTLFFGSRPNVPFIVVLAVDPHIVISAIQQSLLRGVLGGGLPSAVQKAQLVTAGSGHSMNSALSGGTGASNEITGYDYMRNIVTMPFFLDCSGGGLQHRLRTRGSTKRRFRDAVFCKRSETAGGNAAFFGSRLSLREADRSKAGDTASTLGQAIANSSLFLSTGGTNAEMSNLFPSFDYFSNMNPRTMHRIVNSIALTGRLMRTFDVEFSWFMLYLWISLIEQWPYRMCWIIECCCTEEEDDDCFGLDPTMPLNELYLSIKDEICLKCQLASDLDRNVAEFEALLLHKSWKRNGRQANKNATSDASMVGNSAKQQQNYEQQQYVSAQQPDGAEQITIRHVQVFVNCTSILDPYLRKMVRELRASVLESKKDLMELNKEKADAEKPLTVGVWRDVCIFGDESPAVWNMLAAKPLVRMTIDEVVALITKMNISSAANLDEITKKFYKNNLNGLVLQMCDVAELKELLQASLGDWTLVKLLIETLRKIKPNPLKRNSNAAAINLPRYTTQFSQNRDTFAGTVSDDSGAVPPQSAKHLLSIKEERNGDKIGSVGCPVFINFSDAVGEDTGLLHSPNDTHNDEDGDASSQSLSDSDSLKSVVGSQQNLVGL